MADCKACGKIYYPTAEEQMLIVSGDIEEICLECAMAQADDAAAAVEDDWAPVSPLSPREKVGGFKKLYRVEHVDNEGRIDRFLSIQPRPLVPTYSMLRREKPYDLHVDVLGSKKGIYRGEHEPEVFVHTNIDTFTKTGQPFWAKKTPSFICPMTGVDVISVERQDILCLVNEAPGLRVVKLKNGEQVNLRYK